MDFIIYFIHTCLKASSYIVTAGVYRSVQSIAAKRNINTSGRYHQPADENGTSQLQFSDWPN